MALGQEPEQRFAGDLRHDIPHRHVDRADGHRALAMPARLLIGHHHGPDTVRVEIAAIIVQQAFWIGLADARSEPLANEPALAISGRSS